MSVGLSGSPLLFASSLTAGNQAVGVDAYMPTPSTVVPQAGHLPSCTRFCNN